MDFTIKNLQKSVSDVSRQLGYLIIDTTANGEYNLVRRLTGGNFPRFHIYLKVKNYDYNFSLHLDQKAPVYKGSHAHNGEYFGPIIDDEVDRIKGILGVNL